MTAFRQLPLRIQTHLGKKKVCVRFLKDGLLAALLAILSIRIVIEVNDDNSERPLNKKD